MESPVVPPRTSDQDPGSRQREGWAAASTASNVRAADNKITVIAVDKTQEAQRHSLVPTQLPQLWAYSGGHGCHVTRGRGE